jgi:6-pyruvoyltetrahydropterin/6-carboxytetrahydropterin synthase
VPYTIAKDVTFAAAHFIEGHPGPCQHLHGHNYRVRVFLSADELDDLGMVVDFADLKKLIGAVVDRFDHRVINEIPPFDRILPTAELLSEHIYLGLVERLDSPRVRIARVEVWENERSCALFEAG